MKIEDLNMFDQMLREQLYEIQSSGRQILSEMKLRECSYADLMDLATDSVSMEYELRIRGRESRLIDKIKNALMRIEDGSFGYCEECEEEIEYKRLLARPVAQYCISCKINQENREKHFY